MADPLVIRREYEGVVTLELNRPEARNALSFDLRAELQSAIAAAEADDAVRVILITGNDDVFAAGADIKFMSEAELVDVMKLAQRQSIYATVADCTKPVIAGVSGWALGAGMELALAADIVVASETAEFGLPEVTLGIIPGGGGTQRLTRLAGKQKATEIILTGRRIDAAEAKQIGLVSEVVKKSDDWRQKALDIALVISRRPPVAVRLAKQAIRAAEEEGLSGGLQHERRLFELAMATEDRVEGMTAFVEKRRPEFKGR